MSNGTVPFSLDGRAIVRLVNYVENEIFVQMKSSVTFQLSTGKVTRQSVLEWFVSFVRCGEIGLRSLVLR